MAHIGSKKERTKKVVRAGKVGIVVNLLLSAFKALVGFSAGSIAIILDAVNNLTDAISNIVTILGTVLANKPPDAKHPYGYGRVEYMASMIISGIILYAGISALVESVKKILWPERADYTTPTLIVVSIAIVVKICMSLYFRKKGKETDSFALLVSSVDARTDVFLTGGTLLSALLSLAFSIDIDGLVGAIIAVGIIKAGVEAMKDSVGPVIGDAVDSRFAASFTEFMLSYEEVEGVYDISVDDYGPTHSLATCHIEVADTLTARQIHELSRRIGRDAYKKYRILLTIGIYATNTHGKFAKEKEEILAIVAKHPSIKSVHALYIDPKTHFIDFDIVLEFSANGKKVREALAHDLAEKFPKYRFSIVEDVDYSS